MKKSELNSLKPFLIASVLWLAIGTLLCRGLSHAHDDFGHTYRWMILLWAVCLADLGALAKTVHALIQIAAGAGEKQPILLIETFFWGFLKLICLGIFGVLMFRGEPIPSVSLLVGFGTLIVVPLFGGMLWSRTGLIQDARP